MIHEPIIGAQLTKKEVYKATTFRKKGKKELQLPFQWESQEIYIKRGDFYYDIKGIYVKENLDGLHLGKRKGNEIEREEWKKNKSRVQGGKFEIYPVIHALRHCLSQYQELNQGRVFWHLNFITLISRKICFYNIETIKTIWAGK